MATTSGFQQVRKNVSNSIVVENPQIVSFYNTTFIVSKSSKIKKLSTLTEMFQKFRQIEKLHFFQKNRKIVSFNFVKKNIVNLDFFKKNR